MKKFKKFEKSLQQSAVVFKKLEEEMQSAKSQVLKDIIRRELDAYMSLTYSFMEYVDALGQIEDALHNEALFEEVTVKQLITRAQAAVNSGYSAEAYSVLHDMYALVELSEKMNEVSQQHLNVLDESCNILVMAIERNTSNWLNLMGGMAALSTKICVDIVQDAVPPVKVICTLKEVSDTIQQHTQKVPDYTKTDNELQLIETHTKILNQTSGFFDSLTARINGEESN